MPDKFLQDSRVIKQEKLAGDVYLLMLHAPSVADLARPGQFAQIRLLSGAFVLRRPLGIVSTDHAAGTAAFIYRVVGRGTRALSRLSKGDMVNILGPLGHGFSTDYAHPLLVGGGMGLSPLFYHAMVMRHKADVLMGGKSAGELFWKDLYEGLTSKVYLTTDDGSLGEKGFVTDYLSSILEEGAYDSVVTCGPEIMMKKVAAIAASHGIPCEVSLERRMGCGLGACLSCTIDTVHGRRKVCKDGPVFKAEEVFFG